MYRRRKIVPKENPEIPNTLEGFGYVIKENGEVRSVDRDEPYQFEYVRKDRAYNEERYDAFMDLVGDVIENKLQSAPYNFKKVIVPLGADPSKNEPYSYIYMTPHAMDTTGKLAVLIPGNHTRIGQWSKRVTCDDTIYSGSMMQVSSMFIEKGYEVIILNSNANFWYDNKAWDRPQKHNPAVVVVPENGSPEEHCQYVFHNIIRNTKASSVAVMATGWGGHSMITALNKDFDYISKHVEYISIINSVHSQANIEGDNKKVWFRTHCVNWVLSEKEKEELIRDDRFGCTCYSTNVNEIPDYIFLHCLTEVMNDLFVNMKDIKMYHVDLKDTDMVLSKDEEEELNEHLEIISIN